MLSLDAIANWEIAVLASIRGATGTIAQRDAQITRAGMYAEYPAIIDAYAEIYDLEALKRAIFLVWYSFAAPSTDSGISDLSETAARYVMGWLDRAITSGEADDELRYMLAWYRDEFGEPFDLFGPVASLDPFVREVTSVEARARLAESSFTGRGQLGEYWAAMTARD